MVSTASCFLFSTFDFSVEASEMILTTPDSDAMNFGALATPLGDGMQDFLVIAEHPSSFTT